MADLTTKTGDPEVHIKTTKQGALKKRKSRKRGKKK